MVNTMGSIKTQQSKKVTLVPPQDTEQRILAAARAEFANRGLEGARMQSIADRKSVV
jgi:AcrR family transcriptional regulator